MRLLRFLTTGVTLVSYALAQDLTPEVSAEKHHYQVRHCLRVVVSIMNLNA